MQLNSLGFLLYMCYTEKVKKCIQKKAHADKSVRVGLSLFKESEMKQCRINRSARADTPDADGSPMNPIVRNTGKPRKRTTTNTNALPTTIRSTEERGNESVTDMPQLTLFVKDA